MPFQLPAQHWQYTSLEPRAWSQSKHPHTHSPFHEAFAQSKYQASWVISFVQATHPLPSRPPPTPTDIGHSESYIVFNLLKLNALIQCRITRLRLLPVLWWTQIECNLTVPQPWPTIDWLCNGSRWPLLSPFFCSVPLWHSLVQVKSDFHWPSATLTAFPFVPVKNEPSTEYDPSKPLSSFKCNKTQMDQAVRWLFFFNDPERVLPSSQKGSDDFCE